ncbi:MAG: carbohydrate kinase family protein [bacterium]
MPNRPKQFDIVGFGICTVDFLGLVSKYPEAGQKILMEAFSKQGGGLTGTALTAAARLGAKTAYIGKFGQDAYSQFLLDEFQKEGVDVRHVIFKAGAQPPISFIHVEKNTGERRITWHWKAFQIKPEELNQRIIQNNRILFLDHFFTDAGLAAVHWIKESGGCVVVDAERLEPRFEDILHLSDYIIASSDFAAEQTRTSDPEKGAHLLQEKYGGVLVITAGEKGVYCKTPEGKIYQPAFAVQVVDTTGAGDVFHGAFMVGLLENWPLQKILEFSAAVAALKCRGLGGRANIPNKQEVLVFLRTNGTPKFWN